MMYEVEYYYENGDGYVTPISSQTDEEAICEANNMAAMWATKWVEWYVIKDGTIISSTK